MTNYGSRLSSNPRVFSENTSNHMKLRTLACYDGRSTPKPVKHLRPSQNICIHNLM
ncbi:hypothetical protein PILCRDRAFT_811750 [Piloderma croceum F 1598]|uniref:Uncharacterized protein n=1 Tax=Piloderma croceum (strain F 1598) TaxID=765440 RepID=A0A0C3BXG8_PILCF|nr:hypothetical protein PILCRDRAFT_811750 [Piloderma croceum F 1598]